MVARGKTNWQSESPLGNKVAGSAAGKFGCNPCDRNFFAAAVWTNQKSSRVKFNLRKRQKRCRGGVGGGGGVQQRSTPACESSQGCIEKRCKENIHLAQRYIIPQTKLSSLDESLGLLDCIGIFPPLEPLAYAQCDIKGREGFHFDFGWNALAFRGKRLATATKF